LENLTHFKKVTSGKSEFADSIVPDLDADKFEAFRTIFETFDKIVEHDKELHH